jgi:DNA invertase Pin-like site-specific DNA recombinase
MRAVAYLRCSTDEQENSVDRQRGQVADYAAARGYEIIRAYVDDGISGWKERPGFNAMAGDASERGDFDAILVSSLDRFSRLDPWDFCVAADPFKKAGVRLVTVDEGVKAWDRAVDQVMLAVSQLGKSDYCKSLSFHIMSSLARLVSLGGWPNYPPYAYRIERRPCPEWEGGLPVLVPDDKAWVVRELFQRYASGEWGLRQLAADLNARGIKAAHGGPWCAESVRRVLLNEAYVGTTVYNRTSRGKFFGLVGGKPETVDEPKRRKRFDEGRPARKARPKVVVVANPESEHLRREGTHEPLVSPELFARVAQQLKRRLNHKAPQRSADYVFRGLLFCGHCASAMTGCVSHVRAGRPRLAYKCGGFMRCGRGFCRFRQVYEDQLLDEVGTMIWHELLGDAGRAWEERLRAALTARHDSAPDDLARIEAELAKLDKDIARARGNLALLPPDMLGSVVAKIREMEARQKALKVRQADVGRVARHVADIEGRVREARERMCAIGHMLKDGQREHDRRLLGEEVKRVVCRFREEKVVLPKRGEVVRSRLESIVVEFQPESLLGADALCVWLGDGEVGEMTTLRLRPRK